METRGGDKPQQAHGRDIWCAGLVGVEGTIAAAAATAAVTTAAAADGGGVSGGEQLGWVEFEQFKN